jgi:hypothetical protein
VLHPPPDLYEAKSDANEGEVRDGEVWNKAKGRDELIVRCGVDAVVFD